MPSHITHHTTTFAHLTNDELLMRVLNMHLPALSPVASTNLINVLTDRLCLAMDALDEARSPGGTTLGPTMIHDQAKFMRACGQTTTEDNHEQSQLYLRLIQEEGHELEAALLAKDTVEEFDAVLDLIVVLMGYGLSRGFPMVQGWGEVMRSNLAKIDPRTGTVTKRADGKILKPEGWQAPDLAAVLAAYNKEAV